MEMNELYVGNRIREARIAAGLSVRQLAGLSDISPSSISQIENGKSIPNILTLKRLADGLGISMISLLLNEIENSISYLKADERHRMVRNVSPSGVIVEEFLTRGANTQMEPAIITVPPGTSSGPFISHQGEEFVFVLEGKLEYCLKEVKTYHLSKGDTLYYPASIPHGWTNNGTDETIFLIVATPPTF